MKEFITVIERIIDFLLDFLQVLPEVLTFPVVILIIVIIFHEPLAKLLYTFSNYISSKANALKNTGQNVTPSHSYSPQQPVQQKNVIHSRSQRETSSHVHQNLAQAYAIKGSYEDAIGQYQAAISADPENISAYIGLGNAYYKKGMHSEAIHSLERAVEIKPYWADCRCNLGAAYSLAGMHDKAIEEFVQAININPNYAAAHYGLGIAYISASKYEKAKEQVEVLKELEPAFSEKLRNSIADAKESARK